MIGRPISSHKFPGKLNGGDRGEFYKGHHTKLNQIVTSKFLPHYPTTDKHEIERTYYKANAVSALMQLNVAFVFEANDNEHHFCPQHESQRTPGLYTTIRMSERSRGEYSAGRLRFQRRSLQDG